MASRLGRLPVGFWLAIAAGAALRAWYLFDLAAQPWFGYPIVDSLTVDRLAQRLLEGEYREAFFRPPLYPYFLALLYAIAGRGTGAVEVVQSLIGLAALVPAYRLGERWFGRPAALAGVWVAACYPLRIFFEGELLDVTLFGFLFLWGTWILWRGLEEASALRGLLAGLVFGLAALTRPNVLIALPLVALGSALAFREARSVGVGAAAALGLALAIAPATVHNWRADHAFIPIAGNGGVNFYLGNERDATGLTPVPPGLRWQEAILRPIHAGRRSLAEQDHWWYGQAAAEIVANPGRWLHLLGVKAALFLNAAESSNNKALAHFTSVSLPVRHYRWWFGTLVCLGLVGCAARPGRGPLFLACLCGGHAVSVVLFFVAERYRLPLVPLLAPAAAAGAGETFRALFAHDNRRLVLCGSLLAVSGIAVFPDWFGAGRERISAEGQMGQIFLMRGEPDRALASIERARAAEPDNPDLLNLLGSAHIQRGDLASAEEAYHAALALGDFGEVWYNLAVTAERRGHEHRELAVERYRRALAANPADPRARANLDALESR